MRANAACAGTDGNLWKYWGDAVRCDGRQGGAAAELLTGRGQLTQWHAVDGPDWQGPIWTRQRDSRL
jgi:hypothetical protein